MAARRVRTRTTSKRSFFVGVIIAFLFVIILIPLALFRLSTSTFSDNFVCSADRIVIYIDRNVILRCQWGDLSPIIGGLLHYRILRNNSTLILLSQEETDNNGEVFIGVSGRFIGLGDHSLQISPDYTFSLTNLVVTVPVRVTDNTFYLYPQPLPRRVTIGVYYVWRYEDVYDPNWRAKVIPFMDEGVSILNLYFEHYGVSWEYRIIGETRSSHDFGVSIECLFFCRWDIIKSLTWEDFNQIRKDIPNSAETKFIVFLAGLSGGAVATPAFGPITDFSWFTPKIEEWQGNHKIIAHELMHSFGISHNTEPFWKEYSIMSTEGLFNPIVDRRAIILSPNELSLLGLFGQVILPPSLNTSDTTIPQIPLYSSVPSNVYIVDPIGQDGRNVSIVSVKSWSSFVAGLSVVAVALVLITAISLSVWKVKARYQKPRRAR